MTSISGILAAPIRIRVSRRVLLVIVAVIALVAGILLWAGSRLPPPRFMLDKGQGSLVPIDYPLWRRLSDRLAGRKYALLTFDDGPYGNGVDQRILDILQRHHAHAIFFLVCAHLTATTDDVPREIEQAGDLLGNHSYDHPHLPSLDAVALKHEIDGCSARLATLSGHRPRYFRPPFGQTSAQVRKIVRSAGMQQVLWDANSQDSWLKSADQILYWSLEETSNGSILLMHSKPGTAAVLDRVLTDLERHGFRFVLPDDLVPVDRGGAKE